MIQYDNESSCFMQYKNAVIKKTMFFCWFGSHDIEHKNCMQECNCNIYRLADKNVLKMLYALQ